MDYRGTFVLKNYAFKARGLKNYGTILNKSNAHGIINNLPVCCSKVDVRISVIPVKSLLKRNYWLTR